MLLSKVLRSVALAADGIGDLKGGSQQRDDLRPLGLRFRRYWLPCGVAP